MAESVPAEAALVAVAQFAPGQDPQENFSTIRRLAEAAVDRGATLVVFPEYSSYFATPLGQSFVDGAEPLDGPFIAAVAGLARNLSIHIVVGLVERLDREARAGNTLVAIGPDGKIVATYRKLHLYDAFGDLESAWIKPGDVQPPQTFEFAGLTVGLQTCYDLRFPEVTRTLVDAGAELVLVPSEWVRGPLKEHHWRTLVTARALENTIFVAAADHLPPIGVGNSMIVDPMGVEIATAGEREGIAVGEVSRERVEQVRLVNPALALRRFSVVPRS